MTHMKKLCFRLEQYSTDLVRLGTVSWLSANTMFLLGSHVLLITPDFIRQISLESFLRIWMGTYLRMTLPYLILTGSDTRHVSLVPSTAIYIATLALQGNVVL